MNQNRTGGYIALCTTSVVWGTTWVASKIGVSKIPAFQMAAIRQLLAGLCFVLFFMIYKKLPLPTAKQFGMLLVMSILMFVGANGLSTWSLDFIPTGLSCLIGALYPLSVVIIEMIFFRNRNVSILTFLGLLLGIGGTFIVFYENAFHGIRPAGFFFGVFLSFVAMLTWSIGSIIIAKNKMKIDPYYSIGWQMLISSGLLYLIALASGKNLTLVQIPGSGWLAVIYLVVAGSLIAYAAFVYSMKTLPPALFSLYAYINPLVAMVVAGFLLKEKLNMNILWGAIVTLSGVFLVNYSIRKNRKQIMAEPEQ
ncbi:MAG: EamA family transporter [Bacteroidota bacterium]